MKPVLSKLAAAAFCLALTFPMWAGPSPGIVVDSKGQVYFVDSYQSRIMKVDAAGELTTFIDGTQDPKIPYPKQLAVDKDDNIYTAGGDAKIWKISAEGKALQVYPDPKLTGLGIVGAWGTAFTIDATGGMHCVHFRQSKFSQIVKVADDGSLAWLAGGKLGWADGKAGEAKFGSLLGSGFALTSDGALVVGDMTSIRKVSPDGVVTTLAGSDKPGYLDGPATEARFDSVSGVAVDAEGNIFAADTRAARIRKISPAGRVSTFAGSGRQGKTDGPALTATFVAPFGVAVSRDGIVYVLDFDHTPSVRKIGKDGNVSTLASVR